MASLETVLVNDMLKLALYFAVIGYKVFGVSETVLIWFRSYLFDCQQFVCMSGFWSEVGSVCKGVPQGSILGPLIFSICIFPLGLLLRSLGLIYHFYFYLLVLLCYVP